MNLKWSISRTVLHWFKDLNFIWNQIRTLVTTSRQNLFNSTDNIIIHFIPLNGGFCSLACEAKWPIYHKWKIILAIHLWTHFGWNTWREHPLHPNYPLPPTMTCPCPTNPTHPTNPYDYHPIHTVFHPCHLLSTHPSGSNSISTFAYTLS